MGDLLNLVTFVILSSAHVWQKHVSAQETYDLIFNHVVEKNDQDDNTEHDEEEESPDEEDSGSEEEENKDEVIGETASFAKNKLRRNN